jgi:hypothetical protein
MHAPPSVAGGGVVANTGYVRLDSILRTGRWMGVLRMSINDFEDDGQSDYVSELLNGGYLEGPEIGAAEAFLKEGYDELSSKQKLVFDRFVIAKNDPGACKRNRCEIPWPEKYEAKHNGGFCGWCANVIQKANKDD